MKLKNKIIDLLQSIIAGRKGWCGDHGVYTPQLNSTYIDLLLKECKNEFNNQSPCETCVLKDDPTCERYLCD